MADRSLALVPLRSKPGIKRDGTLLEGDWFTDGQWCRFDPRGNPRKMGGYRQLSGNLPAVARGMYGLSKNGFTYIQAGHAQGLIQLTVNNISGIAGSPSDRTPVGFTPSANAIWRMEGMFDGGGGGDRLVAWSGTGLNDISDTTDYPIYYGQFDAATPLTPIASSDCSGGLVVLYPYLFGYGNNGLVFWSVANEPSDFMSAGAGEANVTDNKIVQGLALRGGPGSSPSGLFWSLDSLIRVSFIGGDPVFDFDTISQSISVMSSRGITELDGNYYWVGLDRFYMYNGVVRELVNPLSGDFFFDSILPQNRQRVFAFVNPRWGEIWWCFPRGDVTEPNWAVIYNTRLQTWYDTPLPNEGRSDGMYYSVFGYPVLGGVQADPTSEQYPLWQHEHGKNEIGPSGTLAISSYYTTSKISMANPQPGQQAKNVNLACEVVEPDYVQVGDLELSILGQPNPRVTPVESNPAIFGETFGLPDQIVNFRGKNSWRIMRFKLASNVLDGDYLMGNTMLHLYPNGEKIK